MRKEAQQAGCSAFFPKPVPTKQLLEAINQAVNPGGDDSHMDAIAAAATRHQQP
jgi:FixJ family two-component response regulator